MLNPGDLVFVRGYLRSPVDDAIKLGETLLDKRSFDTNYVHVAVYVGGNTVMEAQGLRKSGPANIGDYTGDYDIGHITMTYEQRQQFLAALQKENNLPYDWLGIFWLAVKALTGYDQKYREHRRRYCSKYVGWALWRAGISVNDETPESLAHDARVTIEKS
ncbi:hypothetical protein [Alicyclobacillus ferrooxydans]|uniref:LRAT domain-containing protein n=1 Tax=Alicyclobacillus ferrooxydans TaxID=471514 RepID=A0A0N8PNN6_9BACL|nr:hypothetical protein [Alicyclobacillus ferrooxydans]KPV42029.1 hypothetical protein AN477_19870 [Alicyclobacillus ferrooxydans]